jgi:hypothetical protein
MPYKGANKKAPEKVSFGGRFRGLCKRVYYESTQNIIHIKGTWYQSLTRVNEPRIEHKDRGDKRGSSA